MVIMKCTEVFTLFAVQFDADKIAEKSKGGGEDQMEAIFGD